MSIFVALREIQEQQQQIQLAENAVFPILEQYAAEGKVGIIHGEDWRAQVCGLGGHADIHGGKADSSPINEFKGVLYHVLSHAYEDGPIC